MTSISNRNLGGGGGEGPGGRSESARSPALLLLPVAPVLVVVAGFLPWVHSGEVDRNAFQVARVADHLDLARGAVQEAGIVVWYCVPFLAALAVLAYVLARFWMASILCVLVGGYVLLTGLGLLASGLEVAVGAYLGVVGGSLAVGVGLLAAAHLWRSGRRDRRRNAAAPRGGPGE